MDFRYNLVLIYFKTFKDIYNYSDLVDLLGLTYNQVDNLVKAIINDGFLKTDERKIISVSDKGNDLLIKNGFSELEIGSLYDDNLIDEKIFNSIKINIDDVYVPKLFTKKFTGY